MGLQVSKEIRSRLEYSTLEELLADDKYIEELQRHLPKLPKRSQSNLAKTLALCEKTSPGDSDLPSKPDPPPKDRNSRTSKLGPLWSIKSEDITISESVAEELKRGHCSLLRQWSKNDVLKSPEDHYEYTCSVETHRALDRILWRFLTTSYYDIISELDATKQRLSTKQDGGVAFVVAVICQSGKHDPLTVRKRVIGWANTGRKYRGFMESLCSGCIILFPEKISDLLWEQYVTTKTFHNVIQFLQDLGIASKCKEEGWNDLSDKILQTLRVPFRSLIPFQFQPDQIGWAANSSLAPAAQLAKNGLIKIKSNVGSGAVEQVREFYVRSICAGRTLLKDNAYVDEVLPLVDSDRATNLIATALTCSYYKEYLSEGSAQKEKMKKLEIQSLVRAMDQLQQNAPDAAKMLMIHHAIINPEMHKLHWTDYLYQLQDSGQQASLVIATHAIWLMAILPLTDNYRFQTYDYNWIGYGEETYLTKVHGIVGTSRKMVYFQYLVRVASKFPDAVDHENLLRQIAESQQWVDLTEERMPTRIALDTAETYKLATQLYALVRLYRLTPNDPYVRQICYRFTRALCELPASGDEYSGLHPAWCFLIAAACTDDPVEYENMYKILEFIGGVNKSNVLSLTMLVNWMWEWKNGRDLSAGWWEEMTEYLDSKMGGKLICVT